MFSDLSALILSAVVNRRRCLASDIMFVAAVDIELVTVAADDDVCLFRCQQFIRLYIFQRCSIDVNKIKTRDVWLMEFHLHLHLVNCPN
mmetsp:Transcript_43027/g.50340  ORF Transcript_43027/g.50340 Transcript_43027/m.50340 type:complete len:89 (+) Transcript_43027:230-496(+)